MHNPVELAYLLRHAAAGAVLYGTSAARIRARVRGARRRRSHAEERLVFVVGCPRSGTTFLAQALGAQPGFVDLGEVKPWKAVLPRAVEALPHERAALLRRTLERARWLGGARSLRGVEGTPETSIALRAALAAYPRATAVHVIRDGRDVAASLLERGWLSAQRSGRDDVRSPFGAYARFWVEPERRDEFEEASDARRAAWAWRRYVTAARSAPDRTVEVRYEALVADPKRTAEILARRLDGDLESLAEALSAATTGSLGRWRRDLDEQQLADVEAEAGPLLRDLGYADPFASLQSSPTPTSTASGGSSG